MKVLPSIALALSIAAPVAAQTTWYVDDDGGPGIDFTDLYPAVLAASGGDTIVVSDGSYGAFGIDGRSLTITAAPGAQPRIDQWPPGVPYGVRVLNLGPSQCVTIRGFYMDYSFDVDVASLFLVNNAGRVVIEDVDCTVAKIENCKDVALRGCSLKGYPTLDGNDGIGVPLVESSVMAWNTWFQGSPGDSSLGGNGPGTDGGWGVRALRTELVAFDCTFAGGHCPTQSSCEQGNGGHAVELADPSSSGLFVRCTFLPGMGGKKVFCRAGLPGLEVSSNHAPYVIVN